MGLVLGRASVSTFLLFVAACTSSSTSITAPTSVRCAVNLGLSPATVGASGGNGQITIAINRECTWEARSETDWIALASPTSGQGEATVRYTASPNPVVSARHGAVVVNDQRVEVAQAAAACAFALSASESSVDAAGGSLSLTVTAQASCAWTAVSQASWIRIDAGREGSGQGVVRVRVDANGGAARRGTILVAGRIHTVSQAAVRPPAVEPRDSVSLRGAISNLSGRCPNLAFILQGRPVRTNDDTSIQGRCDRLSDRTEVRVDGLVQPDGSVLALRVRVEDDD